MDGLVPTSDRADIETASEDYAGRFAGAVGEWFLRTQAEATLELLACHPPPARVLDVGGGHAQVAPVLVERGYEVTVVGSAPECGERLAARVPKDRCRFEVGELLRLPYETDAYDVVVSFRLLPHETHWPRLVGELCRVARRAVVVDYPSYRSVNLVEKAFFAWKKRIEGNTRRFTSFWPHQIARAFAAEGYVVTAARPQFVAPMALHRGLGSVAVSRAIEAPFRALGLTRLLGSPVIARAEPGAAGPDR